MTTENETPEQKEPTLADVKRIAEEAAAKAEEAKTAAEAKRDIQQTVKEKANDAGIPFSDEDAKRLADVIIAELEARGAFEEPDEEKPEPQESAKPEGEAIPPPESHPETEAPPRKKLTFAERFVGRKG